MNLEYLKRILTSRVYDVARETPLQPAPLLSARLGNTVLLKREDLQPIFSFKLRGAYNRMAHMSDTERERAVITASAGNHAQGVAYAGQHLGLRTVIVMPATTPEIKVNACRARGAEVVLHGDSYSDAEAHAYRLQAENGMTFVHPYDDPLVIAGQGTIGLEISQQIPTRSYKVFVPVGGGGLIAGIAVFLKSISPEIEIIGVEPDDADAMYQSLNAGERITLSQVGIFVDGVAVRRVGEHTFRLAQQYVDHIVRVSTDEVCAAIKDVFDDTRAIQEPAGALAVAGMKRYVEQHGTRGETLVALTCGANMNFSRLKHVAERAEIGEHREALLAVTIPEQPGAFKRFCRIVGGRNITEFNYRYAPRAEAHIFVGIQLERAEQRATLLTDLSSAGYEALDLTNDELAVVHLRHMVGGRAPEAEHERLYSFEFPERPGALLQFLESLDAAWNISLFHYRNHGSAHGRVLAGIQVPPTDLERFRASLQRLGYRHTDQSENPAYQVFLK
ncbi:threonine dehydratase [Oscillochloris trichoides DG-6]|uniref:L-threonine dehydratase n=1 Tax=Oscillochloris trichoides DG-6 TaxID=765420 RepID=E1IF46_9CHLR|nr:threonine ammonia-lyase, biosynthetic [Oscillochloris trichoides]EFO80187.1 threonine dehydratase [Oscillochloris trichoides DG-6]